jgi:hypothetical protein
MYNHRGQPTGTNHRPTPRLANLVERHLNQKIEDASESLHESQPLLGYTMGGQARYIDPGSGQHALDRYRSLRDSTADYRTAATSTFGAEVRRDTISAEADNIREALASRREDQGY